MISFGVRWPFLSASSPKHFILHRQILTCELKQFVIVQFNPLSNWIPKPYFWYSWLIFHSKYLNYYREMEVGQGDLSTFQIMFITQFMKDYFGSNDTRLSKIQDNETRNLIDKVRIDLILCELMKWVNTSSIDPTDHYLNAVVLLMHHSLSTCDFKEDK